MLRLIGERIRSSEPKVQHRDVSIRFRAMVEDDLAASEQDRGIRFHLRTSSELVGRNSGTFRPHFNFDAGSPPLIG